MLLRIASLTTLLTVGLLAQDFRSTLQGTITDPSQVSVAGAAVTLKNIDTAAERLTSADNDGFYIFQFLAPGNYELSVKAPASVVANVGVVETDITSLGTDIRQEIRDNLPLKGRSSLFMFTLTPGVVNNRYGEDTRPNAPLRTSSFQPMEHLSPQPMYSWMVQRMR